MEVQMYQVFTVKKGHISRRWKVIEHPCFPGQLTLVREYCGMKDGFQKTDEHHVGGHVTLENAYSSAYALT